MSESNCSESAVIASCAPGSAPSRISTSPGPVRTVIATPASGTVIVAEEDRKSRRRDGSRHVVEVAEVVRIAGQVGVRGLFESRGGRLREVGEPSTELRARLGA